MTTFRNRKHRHLPWVIATTLLLTTLYTMWASMSSQDVVAVASGVRLGDLEQNVQPDPRGCIEILDSFLLQNPDHYEGVMLRARAWADLRAWDRVIDDLDQATVIAPTNSDVLKALRQKMDYLIFADRYDEAIEVGNRLEALEPNNPARALQIGTAYYKGSRVAQEAVTTLFESPLKTQAMLNKSEAVEKYITDILGSPHVEDVLNLLLPDGDPSIIREVQADLIAARERFIRSSETLHGYQEFGGFDLAVSRAYIDMLYRSGRLYEAVLEADTVLREPTLQPLQRIAFLEVQAEAVLAIEEFGRASEIYEEIIQAYLSLHKPVPEKYITGLYEAQIRDNQWDWILENAEPHRKRYGDKTSIKLGEATAHYTLGNTQAAVEAVSPLFTTVVKGAKSILPVVFKEDPQRRRDLLLLAHNIFNTAGDGRADEALDKLIAAFPSDSEGRHLRIRRTLDLFPQDVTRAQIASIDAFALLSEPHRNRDDFEQWLTVSDHLSELQHTKPLKSRAEEKVLDAFTWESQVKQRKSSVAISKSNLPRNTGLASTPILLFWPDDPALSYTTIQQLIHFNDLERARNETRKLVSEFPDVLEFHFQLARLLMAEGRLESAIAEFTSILDVNPSDPEVLDYAYRTTIAMQDSDTAASLINSMILEDPLGVGAVAYASRLLESGRVQSSRRLIERLMTWTNFSTRLDILLLSSKIAVAQGDMEQAEALLSTLSILYPDSPQVAEAALQLGMTYDRPALVTAATHQLARLAPTLLPDQMREIPDLLTDAGRHEELLSIFSEDVRDLPAVLPALRAIAQSSIAMGEVDEAEHILDTLGTTTGIVSDPYAVLDRFLLRVFSGRLPDAVHRLRLDTVRTDLRAQVDLCLLVGDALLDQKRLLDIHPGRRLKELGLGDSMTPYEIDLLDACLRFAPSVHELEKIVPPEAVTNPNLVYPEAAADVAKLVTVIQADPSRATEILDTLILVLLTENRSFWKNERAYLAERLHRLAPTLETPVRLIADSALSNGNPERAINILRPVLLAEQPTLSLIERFMTACTQAGRPDWAVGVALLLQDNLHVQRLLADMLSEHGHLEEALSRYQVVLEHHPHDPASLRGTVLATSTLKQRKKLTDTVTLILDIHPTDEDLATICADALNTGFALADEVTSLMKLLADRWTSLGYLNEPLARQSEATPSEIESRLQALLQWGEDLPPSTALSLSRNRARIFIRATGTARLQGFSSLARQLNLLALRLDSGNIELYREYAYLERDEGNIDLARRYFEVLSFVDIDDKQAALDLAEIYFSQLGQPLQAASVIDRSFYGTLPPVAAEIIAARAYLMGNPEDAINEFYAVIGSPLITEYTVMHVARIAYASGQDEIAAGLLELVLQQAPSGHPLHSRADFLLHRRLQTAN